MKSNCVECPLHGKKIETSSCFDISMVAEEMAPERTIPLDIREIEHFKEICLTCKNHRND